MKKSAWYYRVYTHLNFECQVYESDYYDGKQGFETKKEAALAGIAILSDVLQTKIEELKRASTSIDGIAISISKLEEEVRK